MFESAPCCGKGQRIVVPAIFKTFSKNHGIGTRTHAGEEWSQRGSNPRGTAENPCYTGVVAGVSPAPRGKPLPLRPFFSRMGSSPDSMIFRKRFKNSCHNDTLTLPATRCMIPSSVAKKIFKSPHHARRRIKNQIPMIFVASVINIVLACTAILEKCGSRPGRKFQLG